MYTHSKIKIATLTIAALSTAIMSYTANAANTQTNVIKSTANKSGLVEITRAKWWLEGAHKPVIHLIIDKLLQQVSVYSNGRLISTSHVSTGKPGHETPGGIFTILSKNRVHHSNIYSRAPMPFMQRLTWSGIALHKSNSVPDYPASHGCVRLPGKFAKQLFDYTRRGAQVIITAKRVSPQIFTSPDLFDIGAASKVQVSDLRQTTPVIPGTVNAIPSISENPVRVLLTRYSGQEKLTEIQNILKELSYDVGDIDGWMGPQTGRAILAFQKDYSHKVTGALSDALLGQLYRATGRGTPKNGRVYVRLNKKPLFDVAVDFADTSTPLGTHHFTAIIPENEADATLTRRPYWLALSIEETSWAGRAKTNITPPSSAKSALARFALPMDLRMKISAMMTHESTVVISDQGISKETVSKGTDFIVLTK